MATTPSDVSPVMKLPPQAVEAEQSVLGGLMLDSERWDDVADLVEPADFYRREHQRIYQAIGTLREQDMPADVVTVAEWLEGQGGLEAVGGLAYLGGLVRNTPSAANITSYARIVRERAVLRRLIRTASDIIETAYAPEGRTVGDVIDHAEKAVFEITERHRVRSGGFVAFKTLLAQTLDRIDELYKSGAALTGLSTGFEDLDDMTAGLQSSDLIIVAGRPSMGKTALAMNIAESVALGQKLPVAIFSMEMPGQQLAMRMLASLSRISAHKLRTGQLGDDDWPRLSATVAMLAEARILVDDTPGLTPLDLRTRARRMLREEGGLGLVVIDYLQLMQATETGENRATELSQITRALKNLAKELNVPVMALSQLNRSLEQRPNKRPVMSDLRESGAIEQDADVIFFIYRDEVYDEDSQYRGTAEIIIGKQRNGPIGMVRLTFLNEFTRFESYAPPAYEGAYG